MGTQPVAGVQLTHQDCLPDLSRVHSYLRSLDMPPDGCPVSRQSRGEGVTFFALGVCTLSQR